MVSAVVRVRVRSRVRVRVSSREGAKYETVSAVTVVGMDRPKSDAARGVSHAPGAKTTAWYICIGHT